MQRCTGALSPIYPTKLVRHPSGKIGTAVLCARIRSPQPHQIELRNKIYAMGWVWIGNPKSFNDKRTDTICTVRCAPVARCMAGFSFLLGITVITEILFHAAFHRCFVSDFLENWCTIRREKSAAAVLCAGIRSPQPHEIELRSKIYAMEWVRIGNPKSFNDKRTNTICTLKTIMGAAATLGAYIK